MPDSSRGTRASSSEYCLVVAVVARLEKAGGWKLDRCRRVTTVLVVLHSPSVRVPGSVQCPNGVFPGGVIEFVPGLDATLEYPSRPPMEQATTGGMLGEFYPLSAVRSVGHRELTTRYLIPAIFTCSEKMSCLTTQEGLPVLQDVRRWER
jgi:hypothetical protein